MLPRIIPILSISILLSIKTFCQTDSVATLIRDIHYDIDTENYFSEYKNARLIANYYCSKGLTDNDRYSYEVVVIDSVLMCGFDSPETESMNYISYQRKQLLTSSQKNALRNVLDNAGLKQLRLGIPRPDIAAHTKEVIIVNYGKLKLQGGMVNYNLQEDFSQEQKSTEAAKERRQTSSIGGNYDALINVLTGFFTDLDKLKREAMKAK